MSSISEHLNNDEILLLDGGVSTEIRRRGVALDKNVWSGLTTKTHPDEVRSVHEEYIDAGARVITANTFAAARHVLESINLGHESKLINFKSVQLAKEARDNAADQEVWIAGSMSSMPPLTSHREAAIDGHIESSYREQAEVLAEAGADLIIAEMMRDVDNASVVISAARATGLPVWIGYSTMMADNGVDVRSLRWKNRDQTTTALDFEDMLKTLVSLGGQAAGSLTGLGQSRSRRGQDILGQGLQRGITGLEAQALLDDIRGRDQLTLTPQRLGLQRRLPSPWGGPQDEPGPAQRDDDRHDATDLPGGGAKPGHANLSCARPSGPKRRHRTGDVPEHALQGSPPLRAANLTT